MKLKDGVLSLRSHRYYTQVQGQMNVTKTNWADFFVYSTHGHILERIKFDPNFWEMVSCNLTLFFCSFMTKELITHKLQVKQTSDKNNLGNSVNDDKPNLVHSTAKPKSTKMKSAMRQRAIILQFVNIIPALLPGMSCILGVHR